MIISGGSGSMTKHRKIITPSRIESSIVLVPEKIRKKRQMGCNFGLCKAMLYMAAPHRHESLSAYPVLKDFSRADPQPLLPRTHAFTPTVQARAGERPLSVHNSGSSFAFITHDCSERPPCTYASQRLITLFSVGSSSFTPTLLTVILAKLKSTGANTKIDP